MNKTVLIIVRHGNTFNKGDVILRVGARTDLPLTDEGLLQGQRVGKMLVENYFKPEIILTSPLLRAQQSADQIAAAYTFPPPISIADFLTELDYGDDDGKPESEVELNIGRAVLDDESITDEDIIRQAGKSALEEWDKESIPPPNWDVDVEQKKDDWQLFGDEIARHFTGKTVIAVTSNGIAKFATSLLINGAKMPTESLKLATGAFGVFSFDGSTWQCECWNVRPPKI